MAAAALSVSASEVPASTAATAPLDAPSAPVVAPSSATGGQPSVAARHHGRKDVLHALGYGFLALAMGTIGV